jgi:alanine dehydrogenase
MKLITSEQVRKHVTLPPIIAAVESAFLALGQGRSAIFPVARGHGSDPTHFLGVKSGRDGSTGLLGVKAGSYNPSNRARGLAAHSSTTMLIDDLTAAVIAIVEADYLNGLRTAAANAVATRRLARMDSEVLGVIGLGDQAVFEVEAVLAVRPIRRVLAARRTPVAERRFAARIEERLGKPVEFLAAEAVVQQSDVLVTVTPATAPILEAAWVRPGTHISAMGADNVGKMELPLTLVAAASLYVDYPEQAAVIGEAQHAVRAGLITTAELAKQSLGGLLDGCVEGRINDMEITIFDSSGTAIQDIAAASAALHLVEAAEAAGG